MTGNMKVISIDCRRLKKIIRKESGSCLIVDCRAYFSFLDSNIRGSVNANLNSVIVRRSRGGPVPLQYVIPNERAQRRLQEGSISAIVALDDSTPHWLKVKKDSVAQIVVNTLSHLAGGAKICFLKGGYESFHSQYPELCTEVKTNTHIASETEKLVPQYKPDYDQGKPVEILPFLYLGSAYHASREDYLGDLQITAMLNISRRGTQQPKGHFHYKWIPVEDSHMADISSHFQEAIDFIDCVKQSGGKVLVHCEAGISRSPTICMAYIMKTKGLLLEEAFDFIKKRRALIAPNFGFMGQLLQLETEIISSRTPTSTAPCRQERESPFVEDFKLGKRYEASVFTFPSSFLTPIPIQSQVHQINLCPITALP
ncbi:dual specificity protein phosphatase 5-like [Megalops cyprinoides]|uniref:dual specificity protein phosphatase 5-like n=1 Tax=Megalops cyprinoides TaxID=118141 RepID=UPI001863AD66|nr:dual specificity protein phosphatase 5-like [Megalops cyprinoides]